MKNSVYVRLRELFCYSSDFEVWYIITNDSRGESIS